VRRDGIELALGVNATAARRAGKDYVLELEDGRELRGERLLVATGRRPRVDRLGLESVGVEANAHGSKWTRNCARREITGIWPLTHGAQVPGLGRRREHPR
jgi:pyruvate/2-oxoglutarate dehydrogenase complex dihydrolipoamide dehydrogenase (E3) component